MGLARLIGLWQEHYETISETGKSLLPLRNVCFLAPLTSSAVDSRLGLRLYELVSEAQGLTPEKIVLLRGTAPPRMPRF